MAIGIGKLLGFKFLNNFRFPYFSRDIAEFWRRWHISLTTWFRDYLYIPLGGSRVPKGKIVRNTFIIFLVSGFWHGANWTFITWGAFHAVLFLPLILLNKNRKYTNNVAENRFFPTIKELWQMGITFLLVVIGWVFFRAETIGDAFKYIYAIIGNDLITKPLLISRDYYIPLFCSIILLMVVEWFNRRKQHGLQIENVKNEYLRWFIYIAICIIIYKYGQFSYSQFIYFQF
jgi:D-alanyl-lipoteichoic acid acyltransferase DltB (MBOAT superfamily)